MQDNDNLGTAPAALVTDHLQLNGGTLQVSRPAVGLPYTAGERVPDFSFNISEGTRGVTFGEAGGRLEVGLVKGAGYEVFPSNKNPVRFMDAFWEAHDLIVEALTNGGENFAWDGDHF